MIDTTSATPLYAQVKDDLLQKVQQGHFGTTNRIPSEKELAKIYNVSLITVRRAVEELVEGNILQKKTGERYIYCPKTFQSDVFCYGNQFHGELHRERDDGLCKTVAGRSGPKC